MKTKTKIRHPLFRAFLALIPFLSVLFVVPVPAFAVEVGDTVGCVKLKEVFNPQRETRGPTSCMEAQEERNQFTLLEFFTVECGYCHQNLPIFARLSEEIRGTTSSRLVSLTRDLSSVNGYIQRNHQEMVNPVLLDERLEAQRGYQIKYVPTIFLIDQNKKVIFKKIGVLSDQDLEEIRRLVKGGEGLELE